MRQLHRLLADERSTVLQAFAGRVSATRTLPAQTTGPDVVDDMPAVVDALVHSLHREAEGVRTSDASHVAARLHGRSRRVSAVNLQGVVGEYAMLRDVILDLARRKGVQIDDEELSCLLHCIDVAVQETIDEYVSHRDAEVANERGELDAERQRLRTALRLLPVGVAICDENGRTIEVNAAMRALWASTREPFREGTSDWPFRVWNAETREPLGPAQAPMARALHGETVLNEELEIEAYDGIRKTILSSGAPTRDENGNVTGAVVVNVDISAHAEALRESKLAVKTREEILAVVAHDLKNPLNSIHIAASRLERGVDTDACGVLGATLRRASGRMERLVTDLLELAQLEAGHLLLRREPTDLRLLVREALENVRPLAQAKHVWLEKERLEASPVVDCDRERIHQVLANLLGNAVKFTPEGGSVYVRLTMEGSRVVIEVADTGPGIAPDALPHVFKRFWQSSGSARLGHGLGLAIARGIVEAHGGDVWAQSTLGAGSSFFFSLPLREGTSSSRWAISPE